MLREGVINTQRGGRGGVCTGSSSLRESCENRFVCIFPVKNPFENPFGSRFTLWPALFSCQPYAFEHEHLTTIAQFRLSSAGLGNKYPRFAGVLYERQKYCPLCPGTLLTEAHVIFFCPSTEHHRRTFNLHFYGTACALKGLDQEGTLREYLNDYKWSKVWVLIIGPCTWHPPWTLACLVVNLDILLRDNWLVYTSLH